MSFINNILREWAAKVDNGQPTVNNQKHLRDLVSVLVENNLPESWIYEFVSNLMEKQEKFYARNKDGRLIDFDSEEARDQAVKDKGYEKAEKSDEEPKQQEPKGDEKDIEIPAPELEKLSKDSEKENEKNVQSVTNQLEKPKTKESGAPKQKEKGLEKVDTLNTDVFSNPDTGVDDSQFYTDKSIKQVKGTDKFKWSDEQLESIFGNAKFPKKYITVIERALNTKYGTGVKISSFVSNAGAGEIRSQIGELLVTVGMGMNDQEFELFTNTIREHIKQYPNPDGSGILTEGWLNAAVKTRNGIKARLNAEYGEGNWEIEASGWDTKEEVEAIGLPDYENNKGYSTDMYMKIKLAGNPDSILDEVSLKKDLVANFLNSGTGQLTEFASYGSDYGEEYAKLNTRLNQLKDEIKRLDKSDKERKKQLEDEKKSIVSRIKYINEQVMGEIPDKANSKKAMDRQIKIHEQSLENNYSEIKDVGTMFGSDRMNEILTELEKDPKIGKSGVKYINDVLKPLLINLTTNNPPITIKDVQEKLKEMGQDHEKDRALKAMTYAMYLGSKLNPDGNLSKSYGEIRKNNDEHIEAVMESIVTNETLKRGMLNNIREKFPLKALFEGEEKMHLGDLAIDPQILKEIFPEANSFEDIQDKLEIRKEPPPPSLSYIAEAGGEPIPIAQVHARSNGLGYASWKFELKVHPEFGKRVKDANKKLGRI